MLSVITGLFGLAGQGISGFFGLKGKQADIVNNALTVLGDTTKSEQARDAAIAQIIMAEAQSESFLTRSWRPLVILTFTGILLGYVFGYPAFNALKPIPEGSLMAEIFEVIKVAIIGYMPLRTVDKITTQLTKTKNLDKVVNLLKK